MGKAIDKIIEHLKNIKRRQNKKIFEVGCRLNIDGLLEGMAEMEIHKCPNCGDDMTRQIEGYHKWEPNYQVGGHACEKCGHRNPIIFDGPTCQKCGYQVSIVVNMVAEVK